MTIVVTLGTLRVPIRTRTRFAMGFSQAAMRYGWIQGQHRPRSRGALDRAAWAFARQQG